MSVLFLSALLISADALPETGATCELSRPIRVSAKANGRGKKTRLKKGQATVLVSRSGAWSQIRVDDTPYYVRTKTLDTRCDWRTPAPEPMAEPEPASEPEPAPEPDSTAATMPAPSPSPAAVDDERISVAVMDLAGSEGVDTTLLTSLSGVVSQELDQLGAFRAISTNEIKQMLEFEGMKQTLGCDEMSCLAELGGALGVDYIISGSVARVGESYLLQLQLTDIRRAKSVERVSREYDGDLAGLVDETRAAARIAVNDLLAARSGLLAFNVSEEGATIRVDGAIVGVSPLAPVTAAGGVRTVEVEKEGFIQFRRDVDVKKDQTLTVDAALIPSAEYERAYRESIESERAWGWTALGIGVAGLAAAGATYAIASSDADTLSTDIDAFNAQAVRSSAEFDALNSRDEDIGTLNLISAVSAAIGVAGVGFGTYLLLTSDDADRYEAQESLSVSAVPFAGGGMVLFRFNP